jgi:ribonuclease P protein component
VLAADRRLRDSDAFRRTVRSGRRAGSPALVVHVLTGEDGSTPARVGFVVSKAVGNAVVRNRVKRRLRHLVKPHLSTLPEGTEVVVRAQPAAASLGAQELASELTRCLDRATRTSAAARPGPRPSRGAS